MLVATDLAYTLPGGQRVFAGASLRVAAGEAIAVTGPSGVGKSTLLAILGGLLLPARGLLRRPPSPDAYCWILQGLNGLSARRVVDNVSLCDTVDGVDRRTSRARAFTALGDVGLAGRARSRCADLSGGELQRVAVARSLASQRPVILADEPTSQLDRPNAANVMHLLSEAATRGRTVIVVTHDTEALPPAMRVLRLTADGLT